MPPTPRRSACLPACGGPYPAMAPTVSPGAFANWSGVGSHASTTMTVSLQVSSREPELEHLLNH